MKARPSAVVAWTLWGIWFALSVATAVLWLQVGDGDNIGPLLGGYATVGALVATRHPRNAIGWCLIVIAVLGTLRGALEVYISGIFRGYETAAWLAGLFLLVPFLIILIVVPLLFPDGRLLSRRWRPVVWLLVGGSLGSLVSTAFAPGPMDVPHEVRNPYGAQGASAETLGTIGTLSGYLLGVAAALTLASLGLRYRRSRDLERQQLKLFIVPVLLLYVLFAALMAGERVTRPWPGWVDGLAWTVLLASATFGMPLAIAIAIFRYHLYDIDLVINRTVVYGALTAALLAIYAGSSVILGKVLAPVVGGSDLAVAASTLTVAAVFQPARHGIQRVVDRMFFRRRYDAARTLEEFADRLRHELDLDAVGAGLCAAAEDTLQPTHVSLWLRP